MHFFILSLLFSGVLLSGQQQPQPMSLPKAAPNGMITVPGMGDFSMSETEFNEMLEFLSTLKPEELEELEAVGRKILMEQGIDPDTLQPISGAQGNGAAVQRPTQQQQQPELREIPAVQKPEEPKVAENDLQDVTKLVARMGRYLESLIQKLSAQPRRNTQLRAVIGELIDLRIFLRLMGNKDLSLRLATPESATLKGILQTLDAVLALKEGQALQLPVPGALDEDDPYSILGLPYTADEDMIEEAFAALEQRKSPHAVRAALVGQEGLSDKDLERIIKDARRSFAFIEDAYEKLRDPKMRAHVDRQHAARIESEQQLLEKSRSAEQSIAEAFTNAVYSERLLEECEAFFKRYEPAALGMKKSLEAEEAARRQEMEQALYITPYPTYGSYDLPTRYEDSGRSSYGSDSYYPSSGNSYSNIGSSLNPTNYQTTSPSEDSSRQKGKSDGDGSSARKDRSEKDEKKEKDDKKNGDDKVAAKKRSADGGGKKKEKTPPDIMADLGKQLKNFDEQAKKIDFESGIVTPLAEYFRKPVTTDSPIDTDLNAKIDTAVKELDLKKILGIFQDLDKSIEPLLDKKTKKLSPQIQTFYKQKWEPLKKWAEQLKHIDIKISQAITKNPTETAELDPTKILEHVGLTVEPKSLGIMQSQFKSITTIITKIEKLLFPELFVEKKSGDEQKR